MDFFVQNPFPIQKTFPLNFLWKIFLQGFSLEFSKLIDSSESDVDGLERVFFYVQTESS